MSLENLKYRGRKGTFGTYGATAPFIGLLGTVFGIIVAFMNSLVEKLIATQLRTLGLARINAD